MGRRRGGREATNKEGLLNVLFVKNAGGKAGGGRVKAGSKTARFL